MRSSIIALGLLFGLPAVGCSDKSTFISDSSTTTTNNTTTGTTGTTGTTTGTVTDVGTSTDANLLARNLVAVHAAGASQESTCVNCHGDMTNADRNLSTSVRPPHKLHRESQNLTCVDCHTSVDVTVNHSGVKFLRQVNPELCSSCHRSGAIQWYQ